MFSIMKLHKYATESELIQTNRAKTNLKTLYKAIKIGFSEFKNPSYHPHYLGRRMIAQ